MHLNIVLHVVVAALLSALRVNACEDINNYRYCNAVPFLQYTHVGGEGVYQEVTDMSNNVCSTRDKHYSGALSPFNEEISLHFRGPINLRQLAVYYMNSKKRDVHGHKRVHAGQKLKVENEAPAQLQKRTTRVVTSTIYGTGDTCEVPTSASALASSESSTTALSSSVSTPTTSSQGTSTSPAAEATSAVSGSNNGASGDFHRIGYYESTSGTVENLMFLGNHGGQGSGVFDVKFGASLSYSNSKGTAGSPGPEVLDDVVIPSVNEVVVMTDKICENGDCGYVRPGAVAYHGFDGPAKIFLMEFVMPHDGATGFLADQPAVWMLNAQIPRTVQYGECSCWKSGCGELDIAEALYQGSEYLTSTLHSQHGDGYSDYFTRPTTKTMKLGVVFNSFISSIIIIVLPDDTSFDPSLAAAQVEMIVKATKGKRSFRVRTP